MIGGGDWAVDRIVPDCIRALLAEQPIDIRSPGAIRPGNMCWMSGYLVLAEQQYADAAGALPAALILARNPAAPCRWANWPPALSAIGARAS